MPTAGLAMKVSFTAFLEASTSGSHPEMGAAREALKADMRLFRKELQAAEATDETARSRRHMLSAIFDALTYSLGALTPDSVRMLEGWFKDLVCGDKHIPWSTFNEVRRAILKAGMETHPPWLGQAVLEVAAEIREDMRRGR